MSAATSADVPQADIYVENAQDNIDGDGNTGDAESNDGDQVYGSFADAKNHIRSYLTLGLGSGKYQGTLQLDDGHLNIVGTGETIINGGNAGENVLTISGPDVTIAGVTVRNGETGIRIKGDRFTLTDSTVVGNADFGVHVTGNDVTLTNVVVKGNGPDSGYEDSPQSGIRIDGGTRASLARVTVDGNHANGVMLKSVADVSIINSTFTENGWRAVKATNPKSLTVEDSRFILNGEGVRVTGNGVYGREIVVRNSFFRSNSDHAVYVKGTDGDDTVTLRGVVMKKNGEEVGYEDYPQDGAHVEDVETVTVRDVVSSNNWAHGLHITGSQSNVEIINLTAVANGWDGLYLNGATSATLRDGTVTDNGGDGVWIGGSVTSSRTVTVSNLRSESNADRGLYIEGSDAEDKVVIENAAFSSNGPESGSEDYPQSGVAVVDVESVTGTNVTATNSGRSNIRVFGTTGTVSLTNLVSEQSGWNGVSVASATTVEVESATILGSGSSGVSIAGSAIEGREVTLSAVTVKGSQDYGLYVEGTDSSDTLTVRNTEVFDSGPETGSEDYPQDGIYVANVEKATVVGTTVRKSSNHALVFETVGAAKVIDSKFTSNVWGIYINDPDSTDGQAVKIRNSTIANNAEAGLIDFTSEAIVATNNYWGSKSGPGTHQDSDVDVVDTQTGRMAKGDGETIYVGTSAGALRFEPFLKHRPGKSVSQSTQSETSSPARTAAGMASQDTDGSGGLLGGSSLLQYALFAGLIYGGYRVVRRVAGGSSSDKSTGNAPTDGRQTVSTETQTSAQEKTNVFDGNPGDDTNVFGERSNDDTNVFESDSTKVFDGDE